MTDAQSLLLGYCDRLSRLYRVLDIATVQWAFRQDIQIIALTGEVDHTQELNELISCDHHEIARY